MTDPIRLKNAPLQRLIKSRENAFVTIDHLRQLFGNLRHEGTYGPTSAKGFSSARPFVAVLDVGGKWETSSRIHRLPGTPLPAMQIGDERFGPAAVSILESLSAKWSIKCVNSETVPTDISELTYRVRQCFDEWLNMEPRNRRSLRISGCGIDDSDLSIVSEFTDVERLDLSWNGVCGAEFGRLRTLKRLKSLQLHKNPLLWQYVPTLADVLDEQRTVRWLTLPGSFRNRVAAVSKYFPWLNWKISRAL